MKKTILLIGVLMSAFLLAGCNFKMGFDKDAIVKVNGQAITKAQYDEAFDKAAGNSALAQIGIDLRKSPDNYIHLALKQRVINELIVKTLLDQEIKKRRVKVTQDDMEKEYASLIEKIGSKEKFNELLKQNQVSQAQFKNDLKEEVKIQKLVDMLGVVNISDKDVEKYYKQNIESFKYPDKVKSSYIAISADPVQIKDVLLAKPENKNISKEELDKKVQEELALKQKKADELLKQLKLDPTKFAQLAKENSDDPYTASEGGDIGFLSEEEMPPEYAKVAFAQKPNTISDIVVTPNGYYIIMVTDRMKAGVEPLEKVKFELKNYMEQQEKTQLLQKFVDEIRSKATIEYVDNSYNPEELEKQILEAQKKNPSLMDAASASE